jgi:hypothetical protein
VYFTKLDDTFRGWFQLVRTNGALRTGSPASSFTTVVVNSDDSASTVPFVSESVQKPGLYYFDITSSFFQTHGVGEYGISVEVDETTAPKVKTAFSKVIKLSQSDFDSITVSASVTVDVDTIVSGVWNAQTSSFGASGSFGFTINEMSTLISSSSEATLSSSLVLEAVSLKVCEIYQILGLELGSPMTVSTTERVVAAIRQTITGDQTTSVTVTRE